MNTPDELEQLRRDVRYVKDRIEIFDCVSKHSRGQDRHDLELMTSVYHNDGIDEHGSAVVKKGPEYGGWANKTHSAGFLDHLHHLTTHTCEIDGDVAHCETYYIVTMRPRDEKTLKVFCGRYLDRLERRDGVWRIAVRRCTGEVAFPANVSMMKSGPFKGFIKGEWDKSDLSYTRPLQLDSGPVKRW